MNERSERERPVCNIGKYVGALEKSTVLDDLKTVTKELREFLKRGPDSP